MFSGLALATPPGNNGGGNGGCGQGQQTNGCGAQGGAGGAGGQGGNGLGVGIANAAATANAAAVSGSTSGAAVIGSGNSNVRNTNNNANVQGQSQSSRNSNRNTAEGGNAAATGGNSGGNTLTGGAVAVSVEGDKGDMVYAPAQERAPVATAYAAPLVSSNGTCMGSSSGGVQTGAVGITVGTTWKDDDCDRRYDAASLVSLGTEEDRNAARALMQQKESVQKAYAATKKGPAVRVGDTRTNSKGEIEVVTAVTANSTGSVVLQPAQYSDPIIRARLGLPPLK